MTIFRRRRRRSPDPLPGTDPEAGPEALPPHPGIRLRISNLNGRLLDVDSDHLHWTAEMNRLRYNIMTCDPACLPGCDKHGWLELIPGLEMPYQFGPDEPRPCHLRIEIKSVMLSEAPDD